MKTFALIALFLVSGIPAEASQFAECIISSYDKCPNNLLWSCRSFTVYGRDFQTEGWFAYPLENARSSEKANKKLEQLIIQGVCPGPHGNQPPTTIEQKYIDAAEKDATHLGKKLRRFMKHF